MINILFSLSHRFPSLSSCNYFPLSLQNMFEELVLNSHICKAAKVFSEAELSLLKSVAASRLKPDTDSGSSAELFLPASGDISIRSK
jgi:hypothetical protein